MLHRGGWRWAGFHFCAWCVAVCAGVGCASSVAVPPTASDSGTIVFVHGAWGGGWQFHKVQPFFEAAGHRVYRPTLTGLGERVHLAGPDVGLSTHIEDVVNVFEFEALENVILVGHSYGGMVISGVAERVPERIEMLVYLDAILPEDGESVEGLFRGEVEVTATLGEGAESWKLIPAWVEAGEEPPFDVPQPIRTFTETIVLQSSEARELPAIFILTVEADEETDDFDRFAERARDRGWKVVTMEGGHNPQWFQPETLVGVLIDAFQ